MHRSIGTEPSCDPPDRVDSTSCADCSGCSVDAGPPAGTPPIAGPRLVFGSMLLFLGPVVLAVTGAGFGGTEQGQLLGAVAGLAVGMTASAGVAAVVRRTT